MPCVEAGIRIAAVDVVQFRHGLLKMRISRVSLDQFFEEIERGGRLFLIPEKNQVIIRSAVEKNIANNEPIKISFPFGGYKLWSLEETPETDWAELFSIMYFIRWLKPVCALYSKGVVFNFKGHKCEG